ncbi:MAG: outer membrane protein assembly factor BamA [Candidatus Zixiibacteriota bacterium]
MIVRNRHWARIALFVLAAIACTALAVGAQPDTRVVDIEIVGNRVATSSLILGVAAIDLGSPLTPTLSGDAIRRLYRLGIFRDVRLEMEEVSGGLKVYIIIKELPKLTEIEFSGNKKIKSKDLIEKLNLGIGGYISPYLMNQGKNTVKEMYEEKGYFRAVIVPSLRYNADSSEALLHFAVDEKSKVKVDKVILTGCKISDPKKLIGKMRNRKRGFLKSSDFAKNKYDEDLEKIISELHKKGFIDAYLVSDSISIDSESNRMTIYIDLYEGPRYYFGDVSFANNDELPSDLLGRKIKFQPGQIFDQGKYEESLFEISSVYYDIGHLHVNILDERTTRDDSLIDVNYDISEGLPSHVKLVKIIGNTKTKEKVIRREISVLPGQKFSRAMLIRSVRDVMALNYFTNVVPTPLPRQDGDVDIEFKIEEKQTAQISAGAGFNSQDKVVGNVALGIPNLGGNGQNLSFSIDFGSRRNSFSVGFTEPWLFGRPTLLGLSGFLTNRRWFDDYTEARQGGTVRVGRRLRWPDNYFRAFASYSLERNRFFDFDDDFERRNTFTVTKRYTYTVFNDSTQTDDTVGTEILVPRDIFPGSILQYDEQWLTGSRLSFTVTRDSRNLPEFASSGSKISYTFQNTGGVLGGFWQYQKHSLSIAKFIPLFWNISLGAKVQYGVVTSPKGDNRILETDRFNPGGTAFDGVVRGYDDGTLTPDSLGGLDTTFFFIGDTTSYVPDTANPTTVARNYTRVRGKYMLVTNIELQIPIVEQQIYGLLFFDAGNSWLNRRDIKPLAGLFKGVGVGFRVAVPGMGTLGFDFGYPLDKVRDRDQSWNVHFQIGSIFR